MLHATSQNSCTPIALQAPGAHLSPASQHVRRHAGGDTSRTSSSAEPAWRPLGAQQLSMKISVTRRLSSSPATRAHPRHSAQAIWAGDASWHTCCPHALRPHRSERSRCPPCCTSPARPRWSFRLGSRWFDDARRASSNHVVAARRGRTAWTGEVHQARSDTFRLELSDPANLGLDPAAPA